MRFVVDSRYVQTHPSGIGTYVEALIERLPGLAPEARFHLWTHPGRPQPVTGPNVSCHVVRAPADGLRTLGRPLLLDRLERDDVLHFPHSLLGWAIPGATVVTIHDVMWIEQPEWMESRPLLRGPRQAFYRLGMTKAIEHGTRIIAVSRATADRIGTLAPAALRRVEVIHNGVSSQFQPPRDHGEARERAASILGTEAPYFLVVGKNEPYKAHDVALRAFAAGAEPHDRLVLLQRTKVGHGLQRLARRLGIADRLCWLHGLSRGDLCTIIQGARALLQPSLSEGFGMPVLEAMASGCPVVASDAAALVEVAGGAALHAPVGNVDATAAAIRKLAHRPLRAELRARGLERVKQFSWDAAAVATLDVYRQAAATGPGGRRPCTTSSWT